MEQKPVRAGRRAAGEAARAEKDSLVEIRTVLVSAGLFFVVPNSCLKKGNMGKYLEPEIMKFRENLKYTGKSTGESLDCINRKT